MTRTAISPRLATSTLLNMRAGILSVGPPPARCRLQAALRRAPYGRAPVRRLAAVLLPLLAVVGCGGASRPAPAPRPAPLLRPRPPRLASRRPNVVFVLTDDLSSDLLRFMPHVQALRRDGVQF